jgi:hypothetical protein
MKEIAKSSQFRKAKELLERVAQDFKELGLYD